MCQAYVSGMEAASTAKWAEHGFYLKFLLCMHGFFTLVQVLCVAVPRVRVNTHSNSLTHSLTHSLARWCKQVPGVVSPTMALKNYVTNHAKLPTDKQATLLLEFTMGFQQLAILMIQVRAPW